MLSQRAAAAARLPGRTPSARPLAVLPSDAASPRLRDRDARGAPLAASQQRRTLLGLVHAVDRGVYRWAQGVLPPISKTENIALGCGTIGESRGGRVCRRSRGGCRLLFPGSKDKGGRNERREFNVTCSENIGNFRSSLWISFRVL